MDINLIGAWRLISSVNTRDEEPTPTYGDPPSGQIQYTADGRMSAFLMDPEWAKRGAIEADPFTEFFAYAGSWQREGDQVKHHIDFASAPARVGTDFVRTLTVLSPNRIELTTAPEVSKSGKTYVTRLVWERVGGNETPNEALDSPKSEAN